MAPKEARGCVQRPAHAPVTRPKAGGAPKLINQIEGRGDIC
jgi:hypothetical protein